MKVSLELNYSEKAFIHDLEILKKIYSKEYLNEEDIPEDLRKEVELLKLYEFVYDPRIYAKTHGRIDLNYKELVNGVELFSKFVSHHTTEPEFSLDTRDLEAVISLIQGEDIYLQFEEEKSSKNKVWLEPSGAFIQGRICLPYKYLGRVDSSFISKQVRHELGHYVNLLKGVYEKQKAKKIFGEAEQMLDEIMFNIYDEGVACFGDRRYNNKITFDLEKIEEAKSIIEQVCSSSEPKKTYANLLQDSEGGEYLLGYLMCATVALSETEAVKTVYPSKNEISKENLHDFMMQTKQLSFNQIDETTFTKCQKKLNEANSFEELLGIYVKACEKLKLKPPIQFIDKDWVAKISKEVKESTV